jgi:hypothetical protein
MSAIAVGVAIGGTVGAAVAGAGVAAIGSIAATALKPKAPKPGQFTPVDFQHEQGAALQGNLFAMPQIEELATRYNQLNFNQVNKTLGISDPFQNQITTQLSKNRLNWSKGIMSVEDSNLEQLQTAARAIGGGYGGTGMHSNALARNYGLRMFQLQDKAQSSEESWLRTASSIYQPGMFDISSMLVKPGEQTSQATNERDKSLFYQNASNRYQFVNDPWNEFQSRLGDQVGNFLGDGLTYGAGRLGLGNTSRRSTGDWAGEAGKATPWG